MRSLRFRLLLFLAGAILPVAALFLYTSLENRREALAEGQRDALEVAYDAAHIELTVIRESQGFLATLSAHSTVERLDVKGCQSLFLHLAKANPQYGNIVLTDVAGTVLVSVAPMPGRVVLGDRPYFREAVSTGRFSIGAYQIGRITGRPIRIFAQPILDDSGKTKAVLIVTADMGRAGTLDVHLTRQLASGSVYYKINRGGIILSRWPGNHSEELGTPVRVAGLKEAVRSRGEGTIETTDSSGRKYLFVFTPVPVPGENPGLFVAVGIPMEAVFGKADRLLFINLAGLFVISILAFAVAWSGVGRYVLRPLGSIRKAVQGIEEGNLDARTGIVGGEELGLLAGGIDRMAESLKMREEEKRRADGELLASEQKFRDSMEGVKLAAVQLDLKGTVTFCNSFFLERTGWTREEVLGQNWFDRFLPDSIREAVRQRFVHIYRETPSEPETFPPQFENPILTRDGRERSILWNNSILRDRQGRVIGTSSLGEDVTERRQTEEALRSSEERLRQSQKMEAVGQLAGGIAHDFNNLLTVITGYSEILLHRFGKDTAECKEVGEIKRAGERAAKLTQQLLAFSRKQLLQPRILDLNEVVSNMDTMLRRLIGEDIDLRISLEKGLGLVKSDPGQIDQILVNLAVNARDAMPGGGVLTIRTANVLLDETFAVDHPSVVPGPHVLLSVSDSGMGMTEETKRHMFEPFFTTKEKGKGTGLGLSTVYGIVQQSMGHIVVQSRKGLGTTIMIYLPRMEGEFEKVPPISATGSHRGETVLVVEDEMPVRMLIEEVLSGEGYRVLAAGEGSEGLRLCNEHAGPIDLLITDVVMPRMGGAELASLLEVESPGTRVLFISGYTNDAISRQGILDNSLAFLEKPFTPEALLRKVRETLDKPFE